MIASTYQLISNAEDTSQDGNRYYSTGWIVPPCGMDPEIRGDDADGKAMDSVAWPVTEDPEEAAGTMDRALAEAGWRRVSDWRVDGAEWSADIERITYAAHIVTREAQALGEPEIVVMTNADEIGYGDFLISYQLLAGDPSAQLWKHGWSVETGSVTEVQTGYHIVTVKPHDWIEIIAAATFDRDAANDIAKEKEAAWATLIRDAKNDGESATKLAAAAGLTRARIYQIRDGRR